MSENYTPNQRLLLLMKENDVILSRVVDPQDYRTVKDCHVIQYDGQVYVPYDEHMHDFLFEQVQPLIIDNWGS